MPSASSTELLGLVRRAGSESSTALVFAQLSRLIGEMVSAHRVTVYMAENGGFSPLVSEFSSGEVHKPQFESWRRSKPLEESKLAARLRAGEEAVLAKDPTEVIPERIVRTYGVHPLLAMPLTTEADLIGALVVEGDYDRLEENQNQIRELAGIVALALDNAQAFQRERDRTAESEALLEVAAVLTESTELSTVLAAVARNSARVTGFDRASILLVNDSGQLRPVMSQFADGHHEPELWERFRSIRAELPGARQVLDSGRPAAYTEPETAPELNPPIWVEPFKIKSVLLVPLLAWGEGFGVLLLDHGGRRTITPQQMRIAQGVATQGAAAIGIGRLLKSEADSRRSAEEAVQTLRTREAQQAAVAELSQLALREGDLTGLFDEATRVLAKTLEVEYTKILELLPGGTELLLKAGVGWRPGLVGTARIDTGNSSQAGLTLSVSHPVIVEDLKTEARFSGPALLTDHDVVSGVSLVIEARDRPYGVLGVHSTTRRTFTAEDINFVQAVANVVAGAIERHQSEQAVLESESRLQAILDTASDAIISVDDDRIIVFNQQASRVFGYSVDEVLGQPLNIVLPGSLLEGNRQELLGRRKSGEEFPAEITTARVEVGGQRVLTVIVRDVTERNEAQRKIRESERRYRRLFQRSPIAMWEKDFTEVERWLDKLREQGVTDLVAHLEACPELLDEAIDRSRVLNVNAAAVSLMGAEDANQLREGYSATMRTAAVYQAFSDFLAAIWEGRESLQSDFVGKNLAGDDIHCVMHYVTGRDGDRVDLSHVIVALADVTERIAAEERLRELVESKDELIASVSHEIRTPLTAVLGFAQLLHDEPEALTGEERQELLESLVAQSTDVANIVEDLLVAAKADIGKLNVVSLSVDLRAQANQVIEAWSQTAADRITIEGDQARCMADPARVRQIIRNLVSNALRYGGPNICVRVGERGHEAFISVADDGPGVAPEDVTRIFEKYQRGGQSPGLTAALGLGLGLSRNLARLMDGDLTYRRENDEAVFELTLPTGL